MSCFLCRPLCLTRFRTQYNRSYTLLFSSLPTSALSFNPNLMKLAFPRHIVHDSQPISNPESPASNKETKGRSNKMFVESSVHGPGRNLLQETRLEEYLGHIASTSHEVTIEDIERYRPVKSPEASSINYEREYNSLLEVLVRSFSLNQLRQFLHLYHLNPPLKRNKWHLASTIVERQWKWPPLIKTKKAQRDQTEVAHQSFPLDARQAFLLLGKNGADLLALSSKYNVHVSLSTNPFLLKVEGFRGSINDLSQHVDEFKNSIEEQLFALPSGRTIKPETLQRISRLSGVFIESAYPGLIRLSFKSTEHDEVRLAKRLAMHAIFEVTPEVPVLLCLGEGSMPSPNLGIGPLDARYSFYPFSPSRPLAQVAGIDNLFRIRRVQERPGINFIPNKNRVGSLANRNVVIDFFGEQVALRDALLRKIDARDDFTTSVTASFGHILTSPTTPQRSDFTTLPFKGHQEIPKILDWLKDKQSNRLFVPSLPQQLVRSPPKQHRLLHRLVYYGFPTGVDGEAFIPVKLLKFELALDPRSVSIRHDSNSRGVFIDQSQEDTVQRHAQKASEGVGMEPTCWLEYLSELDLMMPDHTMDIRFSVSNASLLMEDKWPEDIHNYTNEFRSYLTSAVREIPYPNPPLVLKHQGVTYGLDSCSIVRQSSEPVTKLASNTDTLIHTESILDLESNQVSRACQVTCQDISSDHAWTSFITQCDILTAPTYPESFFNINNDGDTSAVLDN